MKHNSINDLIFSQTHSGIAMRDYGRILTYEELKKQVDYYCSRFDIFFNGRSFRILFAIKPSISFVVLLLAAIKAGGLVFFYQFQDNIEQYSLDYEIDAVLCEDYSGTPDSLEIAFNKCIKMAKPKKKTIDYSMCCAAFFTSGTTGEKKCVLLTEQNLCSNILAGCNRLHYQSSDSHLAVLPFYHTYAITCSVLSVLYSGGCLCFGNGSSGLIRDINYFNPTFLQLVPMMLNPLLVFFTSNKHSVKRILCGGAHTPATMVKAYREVGISLYSSYGLTECSPGVSCNNDITMNVDSCGLPLECNRIKILDGEIFVSGENVMYGYYGEQPVGEWFGTNDCGFIDEYGLLHVIGRKKGFVKLSNGEKVFPEEVENVAQDVLDILECKVEITDDHINLYILPKDYLEDIEELKERVNSVLPVGKRIHTIEYVIEPFKKTSLQKVRR